MLKSLKVAFAVCCALAGILTMRADGHHDDGPQAEFQMLRMKYLTFGGGGSHGYWQPWWAIDYPLAEEHFFPALRRTTNVQVADEERQYDLNDDRIFQYPFMLMQQPGRGNRRPSERDAARLREYLLRGGFLLVDDLHGEYDWDIFERGIQRVFPDRPIVNIPQDDPLMHVFYDIDEQSSIPGDRHLAYGRNGQTVARMQGPPHWAGIYNDQKELMVAVNHNSDMGDGWEHADDPGYPVPFTALAYKLGINYVIYSMTH
jgi:hypothetical protein